MIDKTTGEIVNVFVRTPYNYDTDAASNETGLNCGTTTRTQQHFKDEVDINTIVERFGVTGEQIPTQQYPTYEEYEGIYDYQTAMNVIVKARETFMTLPAKARARFDNSPQKFMEFIHDPDNVDEAVKLGLAKKQETPVKIEEPVTKETENKKD